MLVIQTCNSKYLLIMLSSPEGGLSQGCGNTMPYLSDLVPFHSGKVENFNLLVLGQEQNSYKVNKILYFIF